MATTPTASYTGHTPTYDELAQAMSMAHRLETALLSTRIERLVALLGEHGIPLPQEDPRLGVSDGEHLAACRQVVISAYDMLERMDVFEQALVELRRVVGTGMELVGKERWR